MNNRAPIFQNLIEKKERINMGPVAYEKFGDEDEDDEVRRSNAERSEASELAASNGPEGLPAENISKWKEAANEVMENSI